MVALNDNIGVDRALEQLEREVAQEKSKLDEKHQKMQVVEAETEKLKEDIAAKEKEMRDEEAKIARLRQEISARRNQLPKKASEHSRLKTDTIALERTFEMNQQKINQSHAAMERARRESQSKPR